MADADKVLKLLIEMGVAGKEDVQAANELLAETGKAAATTGKATEALGAAEKETAGHAEHLHLNHRALHQIMHLIGKETAPELGHALAGALYGPIGIALAVGYAFEGIREHIAKTNEELDKMGEKAAAAYANVKANLFDAIRDEEFSTDKVDKFFKHIEEDAGKAQKAIESALKIAHELESATIKKLKADEENELARIKIDPSLTEAQREAKSAATKTRYAGLIAQQEEKGQNDDVVAAKAELAEKQKELNALLMQKHQQGAVPPEMVAAIDKAVASLPEHDKLRAQFEKDKAAGTIDYSKISLEALQKNIQAEMANLKGNLGEDEQTGRPTGEGDAKRAEDLKKTLEPKIARIEEFLKDFNGHQTAEFFAQFGIMGHVKNPMAATIDKSTWEDWLKQLKDQVETANAAVAGDKKRIEQLANNAAALKQSADSQKKLDEEIEKLKRAVEGAQQKFDETKTIAGIRNNATGYVADKNASTTGFGLVDKLIPKHDGGGEVDAILRAYAAATGKTAAQTAQIIQGVLNHTLNLQTVLHQMQDQLDQQQRQLSNSRNRPGG